MDCHDKFTNFYDPIFYGCCYIIFYVVATVLVLFIPRKYVLALHIGCGTILGFCLNFVATPLLVLVCFTGLISVPGVLVSLASSVMVDLLPIHMRGKALCMGRSLARLGSVIGANLVGLVMKVSCDVTINIFVVYLACKRILVSCVLFLFIIFFSLHSSLSPSAQRSLKI